MELPNTHVQFLGQGVNVERMVVEQQIGKVCHFGKKLAFGLGAMVVHLRCFVVVFSIFLTQILVSIQQLFHHRYQLFAIKWLVDIGIGARLNTFEALLFGNLPRHHHNGDMVQHIALAYLSAHFQTVDTRHHAVGYHDVGHQFHGLTQGLGTVGGVIHSIMGTKKRPDVGAQVCIVFHNEHALFVVIVVRLVVKPFFRLWQQGRIAMLHTNVSGLANVSNGQTHNECRAFFGHALNHYAAI